MSRVRLVAVAGRVAVSLLRWLAVLFMLIPYLLGFIAALCVAAVRTGWSDVAGFVAGRRQMQP